MNEPRREEREQQLRDMNEALLVSSVRQHELTEQAEKSEKAARQGEVLYRALYEKIQHVEAALRESEQRYRTLFEAMDQGYCIVEVIFDQQDKPIDFRYLQVNAPFENQSGLHDVVGKRLLDFVPSIEGHWLEAYGRVALTGEPIRLVHESKGLHRWFDAYAFRAEGWGERAVAVLFTDITQRKRAEDAVARLASIVTFSEDAIISKDLDGIITSWNEGAQHLFGYTAEEVIGKSVTLLIPDDHLDEEPRILECIRRGEVVEHYETVRQRKDGSLLDISLTVSPLRDTAGRIIGASKIARDVSDRRLLEKQTQDQAAALSDLHRRKDEFLAMLSHELRNPLAPIANAVQMLRLQRQSENEVGRQARSIIERQVGQLRHLVDDLLEVSRITTGRVQLRQERVAMSGIVERAVETALPLIQQRRHELTVSLLPHPIWLHADASRLEQVVVNLLTNAAKYTAEGGRIWVTVEVQQDWGPRDNSSLTSDSGLVNPVAVLRVGDTGVGIAPELLPRIFDLFTQAERSLDRSDGGLGIGLCLVQRLVELHGGTVEASSVLGQGSEFVVRLPTTSLASSPSLPAERPPMTKSLRVLVVDDNVDAAESLAMLLKASWHDVRTAYDGLTALTAALDYRPDVVLLDIGLPGLNGYEVAKRIRREPVLQNVVLVAMTGYGQDADRQYSREAGFDRHLVKPADFKNVQKILAELQPPDER